MRLSGAFARAFVCALTRARQPFYNANQAQLFKLIRDGKFTFDSPYWDPISVQAKDLIKGCLTVDITKRLDIEAVILHPWVASKVSAKDITPALRELQKFNARRKLRAGIKVRLLCRRATCGAGTDATTPRRRLRPTGSPTWLACRYSRPLCGQRS